MSREKINFVALVEGKTQEVMTNINRDLETYIYCYLKETGLDVSRLKLMQSVKHTDTAMITESWVERKRGPKKKPKEREK